ncbi:F-box only protein 9 [Lamellibrachia satsuma]|nr:F-box only protein 9 [Lamellibrachia satsuma]
MDDNDIFNVIGHAEDCGNANNVEESVNIEQVLDSFRQQWQDELNNAKAVPPSDCDEKHVHQDFQPSIKEQAKYLFLQGVSAEQNGRLYVAIQYYRRAVQLVPDIELQVAEEVPPRQVGTESGDTSLEQSDAFDEDDSEDLVQRFHRLQINNNVLCQTQLEPQGTHISSLPVEVLLYISKWVVSGELDVYSLEQMSRVCRGFYLYARDDELWRLICHRTWGMQCGRPVIYGSYRNMYLQRPHVQYGGCYISKASYYRQGEKSLDGFYRPYQLVEYYRYVRFFPDGEVLMLTTPEDPYIVLSKMRSRTSRLQGILHGYYRVTADQVTAVLMRRKTADYTKYVYNRKSLQTSHDSKQTFHAEFLLKNSGKRPHWQLVWNGYSVHTVYRETGEESVAEFELSSKSYPTLHFSCVRSYLAVSDSPLE